MNYKSKHNNQQLVLVQASTHLLSELCYRVIWSVPIYPIYPSALYPASTHPSPTLQTLQPLSTHSPPTLHPPLPLTPGVVIRSAKFSFYPTDVFLSARLPVQRSIIGFAFPLQKPLRHLLGLFRYEKIRLRQVFR